jgi:hypothetical protein
MAAGKRSGQPLRGALRISRTESKTVMQRVRGPLLPVASPNHDFLASDDVSFKQQPALLQGPRSASCAPVNLDSHLVQRTCTTQTPMNQATVDLQCYSKGPLDPPILAAARPDTRVDVQDVCVSSLRSSRSTSTHTREFSSLKGTSGD